MTSEYPPGTYYSEKEKTFFSFEITSHNVCRFQFHDTKSFNFLATKAYPTVRYSSLVSFLQDHGYTLTNLVEEVDEELLWE